MMGLRILVSLVVVFVSSSWLGEATTLKQKNYLLTANHKVYEKLFVGPDVDLLATIPLCYSVNSTDEDDTGTLIKTDMSMQDYQQMMTDTGNSPMSISVVPQILQLVDLDEKEQAVKMVIALQKNWIDCRLSWSKDVSSAFELQVAPAVFKKLNVFTPPLRMLEALNPKEDANTETQVTILSNGMVFVMEEFSTEFSCNIDVRMYPFDIQTCYMTFESALTEDYARMYYKEDNVSVESEFYVGRYTPSDLWTLFIVPPVRSKRNTCFNQANTGDCLNDALQFKIIFRRIPNYELINLLFPAFLIVLISSCVFIVPPGGGDKMGLSVTILLSLCMFSQLMYEKMPETGSFVPLLSEYFLVCITLVSASCLYASLSAVFATACPILPACLHGFVKVLGPIFIFDLIKRRKHSKKRKRKGKASKEEATSQDPNEQIELSDMERSKKYDSDSDSDDNDADFEGFRLDKPKISWAVFGALLDRIFFVLHLIVTIVLIVVYYLHGYLPWSGYSGLELTEKERDYMCTQFAIQNATQPDLLCPDDLTL